MSVQRSNAEMDNMYTCPLCDLQFHLEEPQLLRKHMKAVHLEAMIAMKREPNRVPTAIPEGIKMCCALGCNETTENHDLSFFRIPARPRGLVWLINAGRYDMLSIPVELYAQTKMCRKHFEMRVITTNLKTRISMSSLPTIFNHSLEVMNDFPEAEDLSNRIEPQYSNSLSDLFHDTIITERGSVPKKFSLSVVPVDEDFNHYKVKPRSGIKVFRAGEKALIYKPLREHTTDLSSNMKSALKDKRKTSGANIATKPKVNKENKVPLNALSNVRVVSHHQGNCTLHSKKKIVRNSRKDTRILEIPNDDADSHYVPFTSDLEVTEDYPNPSSLSLVRDTLLEHDYSSVYLQSISDFCRMCAQELQNPDEKSVNEVMQALHPLFQKCLESCQDFKEDDVLPEKVCSSCVERLYMCDLLFQQIAEASAKLKAYLSEEQNNANTIDCAGNGEELQEDHHKSQIDTELTNESAAMEEPSNESAVTESCEDYVCDKCPESKVYKTLMDLLRHKVLTHEGNSSSSGRKHAPYVCNKCKKKFMSLKEFYRHPCRKKKQILKTVPRFICHICGKGFTCMRYLSSHIKKHRSNWQCKTCGKSFKTHVHLQRHKRRVHDPDFARICPHCGNVYAKLFQHIKTAHSLEHETFVCHICGKVTTQSQHLKRHIYRMHDHVNDNLPCPYCKKLSSNKYALTAHIRNVHRSTKVFKCEFCNAAYKFQQSLRSHLVKQHPECKLCKKRFVSEQDKNKHTFLEHNEGYWCDVYEDEFNTEEQEHVVYMQDEEVHEDKTVYSVEDMHILNKNVQVIMDYQ